MSDFDPCPECGGEPVSLGIWASHYALRCRDCGWTYYNGEPDARLSEAWGQEVRTEPHRQSDVQCVAESHKDRDGEWWSHRWLIQGPCSDSEALYAAGCPSAHYGGPGRGYANGPAIRRNRSGSRVIVSQTGGLDI